MEAIEGLELRGYRVRGRVQGVGFRWWTRESALKLGLAGWVANRPDGSVEVHVRGRPEALSAFETRLRMGPGHARVEEVEAIDPAAEDVPMYDFEIRR